MATRADAPQTDLASYAVLGIVLEIIGAIVVGASDVGDASSRAWALLLCGAGSMLILVAVVGQGVYLGLRKHDERRG